MTRGVLLAKGSDSASLGLIKTAVGVVSFGVYGHFEWILDYDCVSLRLRCSRTLLLWAKLELCDDFLEYRGTQIYLGNESTATTAIATRWANARPKAKYNRQTTNHLTYLSLCIDDLMAERVIWFWFWLYCCFWATIFSSYCCSSRVPEYLSRLIDRLVLEQIKRTNCVEHICIMNNVTVTNRQLTCSTSCDSVFLFKVTQIQESPHDMLKKTLPLTFKKFWNPSYLRLGGLYCFRASIRSLALLVSAVLADLIVAWIAFSLHHVTCRSKALGLKLRLQCGHRL